MGKTLFDTLRKTLFLIIMLGAAGFASAANTEHFVLNVRDFNEVVVAQSINVVYRNSIDSAGMAVFDCDKALAQEITFSNNKNKLKLQLPMEVQNSQMPTIYLYSTSLTKVENWGDSTITVLRNAPCAELRIKVIGNGNIVVRDIHATTVKASVKAGYGHIYLQGNAQNADYTIMSSGAIEASDLNATNVKCQMWGTGCVDCYVSDELKIYGMGSGDIFYKGDPKTLRNRSIGVHAIEMLQDGNKPAHSDDTQGDGEDDDSTSTDIDL